MHDLQSKVAFITGGASGIGLGMAKAFLAAGMRVAIADVRAEQFERVRAQLSPLERVLCLPLDVTDRSAFARAADATERAFGNVHILCNNAGVGMLGHIELVRYDDWDWCLSVNLGGVVNGVQTFLPRMLAHGEPSHIVNTSSIAAILPGPAGVPYLAAKAGVLGLTQALHADLADSNVRVSALIPGPTSSEIHKVSALRPERFSNSGLKAVEGNLAQRPLFSDGLDPLTVGVQVLDAIRNERLYVLTHSQFKDSVRQHFDELVDAFPGAQTTPRVANMEQVIQRVQELISVGRGAEKSRAPSDGPC
jgi:NAD(P)-dependent dehydrogenase (short-subunit alcohol dehydrogenase family)